VGVVGQKMKCCKDCGKKISKVSIRCKSCSNKFRRGKYHSNNSKKLSDNNPMWKGDKVGKSPLHRWISKRKAKPKFCEECNKNKPYELSNISGLYLRKIDDYRWLCRSCHMKYDYKCNMRRRKNG